MLDCVVGGRVCIVRVHVCVRAHMQWKVFLHVGLCCGHLCCACTCRCVHAFETEQGQSARITNKRLLSVFVSIY